MAAARRSFIESSQFIILSGLCVLSVLIVPSQTKSGCPFEVTGKFAGFRLTGEGGSSKCATVYKRKRQTVGQADDFCRTAFGNDSTRFDSSKSTNGVEIKSGNVSQVKLILDEFPDAQSCEVYEDRQRVNKTPCGEDGWNSFACIHDVMDFCEPVGDCSFNVETSKCKFEFHRFRWSAAHLELAPCETPTKCWCDPCVDTSWNKWKREDVTNIIVRFRAMDNSSHSDCESDKKFCCREVIEKCDNGGKLNNRRTKCTCKPGYTGIICEITPLEGMTFIILVVGLCLLTLIIVIVVVVARFCRSQRSTGYQSEFSHLRSTYWGTNTASRKPSIRSSLRQKKSSPKEKKRSESDKQKKRKASETPASAPQDLQDYEVPLPN